LEEPSLRIFSAAMIRKRSMTNTMTTMVSRTATLMATARIIRALITLARIIQAPLPRSPSMLVQRPRWVDYIPRACIIATAIAAMAVTAATDTATVITNMDMDITTATDMGKGMVMVMVIGSTVAIVGEETVIATLIADTRRSCFASESATCFGPRLEDDTRWAVLQFRWMTETICFSDFLGSMFSMFSTLCFVTISISTMDDTRCPVLLPTSIQPGLSYPLTLYSPIRRPGSR